MTPFRLAVVAALAAASTYGQPAGDVSVSPQPLARGVMYRILFREIAAYQNQADQLAAQSQPDGFVRNYHRQVLQLSSEQAAQLIQIALSCVPQIQAIDDQASAIIAAVKNQYGRSPGVAVPPPPPALQQLEAQRTAVVLSAADSVAAAFGPTEFASFESLVRQHVGSGFQAKAGAGSAQ
jgi:hypothetical protein